MVCRLVRDDNNPYLAYSPVISIEESSVPFRAFLGAILSVIKDVSIESSAYNPNAELEEQDNGPLFEHDIDGGLGEYQGSSGRGADTPPMTRNCYRSNRGITVSDLLVRAFLGRYRSFGSLAFRLLRLLLTRLKISKYGLVFIPCRITRSPFRRALRTINYAYG